MTAQILAAELGNLIQDSKRKNTELRTAAEKSLQDLKSLPQTSESQFSADLSKRPNFIAPFLIACATHNAKFVSTGASCLQRLSVSRALPKERLNEVLEALRESVSSSHDVQLKILQALPSLLQNYTSEVRGDQLSTILQICSELQNAKNTAVSNTAAATLQQLIITVFDRVASEDERALEVPIVTEVKGDDGLVPVRPAANDAYKTFNDLVLLVVGEKPLYMRLSSIPPASVLELIEAVLSNHGEVMTTHLEQIHLLRTLLMPLIIRSLSDRLSFPVTLRIVRILNLMIRNHLEILPSECEIALGLLNHMLDPEASQLWKRVLCLEVFRGIYADSRLLLTIYTLFDAAEGKKAIFGDNLAAFVRLAVEKPALIGLGQQSTVASSLDDEKSGSSESAVAEAGAIAGVIGGPVAERGSTTRPYGISSQWSALRTPCLEHLDKAEPPNLPDTYVYSLVLTCITNISESLAKFVLPLTVHHEGRGRKKKVDDIVEQDAESPSPGPAGYRLTRAQSFRKKTIPINPLDLTDHSAYIYVQSSSTLVTQCWPAVLATCSTFLNATLDTDYYRALVRSIQKFTQVSGLLRLSTPRDAFLTTLGKAAVPSNLFLASVPTPKTSSAEGAGMYSNAKALLSVDSMTQASTVSGEGNRRSSHEIGVPALGPRNLLCLRALVNLAIALGPTLESAWSIVFETLQVADLVMSLSGRSSSRTAAGVGNRQNIESSVEKMESETSAVQAAARRLFESTVDYPNEPFSEVLKALCALINSSAPSESNTTTPTATSRPHVLHQRRLGSVSGISLNTESNSRDSAFALSKIGELASLNITRLSQFRSDESGWDILVVELVRFSADNRHVSPTRLLAADILARTVREIAELSMSDDQSEEIQARILAALQKQIFALHQQHPVGEGNQSETDIRVHQIALDALKSVVEQCGESLVAGWGAVLESLMSIFRAKSPHEEHKKGHILHVLQGDFAQISTVISRSLARSAFATVHLVCSDFLAAVPVACLSTLLNLLLRFSCQNEDLNMSLTTITYFWNVADFLQQRSDLSALPELLGGSRQPGDIQSILAAQSQDSPAHALWFQVLLNLSLITTDERTQVRNSAIQSIQRIFESYDEQLTSEVWMLCLQVILFGMIEANLATQKNIRSTACDFDKLSTWNDTTKAVLETVSVLMTTYSKKIDATQRGEAWSQFLKYLQEYFACNSHALGTYVFKTIAEVLSHFDGVDSLGESSLLETADIWGTYLSDSNTQEFESYDNQNAFVAYTDAFKAIYRLTGQLIDTRLPSMLENLEQCVIRSDVAAYTSDIDNMTTLQKRVVECLSLLNTKNNVLPSHLIRMLSRFCILPYTSFEKPSDKRSPTFVAMAKASMHLLQEITVRHSSEKEIYESGAFLSALQSLARAIEAKYAWEREGRPPTLWQRATTTVITILESCLPQMVTFVNANAALKGHWSVLVDIALYITRAQISSTEHPPTPLQDDERFDIESYKKLRDLTTRPLGSAMISDNVRRLYTRNLFYTSLMHTPLPGELPDLTSAPLDGLYKIRYGQTAQLESAARMNMSYACFRELANIVSVHESDPAEIKLAQAAAPYFILRAALPLKTYIADQPLRGRMPTPESERKELLLVLEELASLHSEPQAIPNAPGVSSKYRKHLHRLYPLLVKVSRVARQDTEIGDATLKLLDIVGDEFETDEDEQEERYSGA